MGELNCKNTSMYSLEQNQDSFNNKDENCNQYKNEEQKHENPFQIEHLDNIYTASNIKIEQNNNININIINSNEITEIKNKIENDKNERKDIIITDIQKDFKEEINKKINCNSKKKHISQDMKKSKQLNGENNNLKNKKNEASITKKEKNIPKNIRKNSAKKTNNKIHIKSNEQNNEKYISFIYSNNSLNDISNMNISNLNINNCNVSNNNINEIKQELAKNYIGEYNIINKKLSINETNNLVNTSNNVLCSNEQLLKHGENIEENKKNDGIRELNQNNINTQIICNDSNKENPNINEQKINTITSNNININKDISPFPNKNENHFPPNEIENASDNNYMAINPNPTQNQNQNQNLKIDQNANCQPNPNDLNANTNTNQNTDAYNQDTNYPNNQNIMPVPISIPKPVEPNINSNNNINNTTNNLQPNLDLPEPANNPSSNNLNNLNTINNINNINNLNTINPQENINQNDNNDLNKSNDDLNNSEQDQSFSSSNSHCSRHRKSGRVNTFKYNKRKMPLEVIDEINGEIYNKDKNVYNIMTNPNQQYKYCKTAGMNYVSGDCVKKQTNENKRESIVHKKKAWKDLKIDSFVPIDKLLNGKENDILMQGEFIVITKENDIKKIENTSKYLIFNRSEIKIYRSKELLLHRKNPLRRVPLFNITQCNVISFEDVSKKIKNIKKLEKYNFAIEFTSVNGMKIEENTTKENNEINGSKKEEEEYNKVVNENNDKRKNPDFQMIKARKMKLIQEPLDKSSSNKKGLIYNIGDSRLIIFSSNDEDLVFRWVCVINYFLSK